MAGSSRIVSNLRCLGAAWPTERFPVLQVGDTDLLMHSSYLAGSLR